MPSPTTEDLKEMSRKVILHDASTQETRFVEREEIGSSLAYPVRRYPKLTISTVSNKGDFYCLDVPKDYNPHKQWGDDKINFYLSEDGTRFSLKQVDFK